MQWKRRRKSAQNEHTETKKKEYTIFVFVDSSIVLFSISLSDSLLFIFTSTFDLSRILCTCTGFFSLPFLLSKMISAIILKTKSSWQILLHVGVIYILSIFVWSSFYSAFGSVMCTFSISIYDFVFNCLKRKRKKWVIDLVPVAYLTNW